MESFLVLILAGLATAIAVGAVEVPVALMHSSVSQAFLLVITLVLFAYSPVVGIAAIALFAILMFKRNVQKTTMYSQAIAQEFAKESAKQQQYQAMPYKPVEATEPRNYMTYEQQNQNQMQMPAPSVQEPYTSSPEEVGMYPIHTEARPIASPDQSFTAMYRPSEDMGDNTFTRMGPNMDEKMHAFAY